MPQSPHAFFADVPVVADFVFDVGFLTRLFRWLAVLLPIAAWVVTYRLCRARRREGEHPAPPIAGHAVVRRPDGGFEEIHE